MRVDDGRVTYEIAENPTTHEPAAVHYVGMTPDGSKVFFTSEEHLTSEDPDTSAPPSTCGAPKRPKQENTPSPSSPRAKAKQPGAPGNTAACTPARQTDTAGDPAREVPWTTSCGVVPYSGCPTPSNGRPRRQRHLRHRHRRQTATSTSSPPSSSTAPRRPGQQNLYDYREGRPHYVATFAPGSYCATLARMLDTQANVCAERPDRPHQVTPDDTHMAFLTADRITSYDNTAGCETSTPEMYSYTPATGAIVCDSCNPDGQPPTADVSPPRTASS